MVTVVVNYMCMMNHLVLVFYIITAWL